MIYNDEEKQKMKETDERAAKRAAQRSRGEWVDPPTADDFKYSTKATAEVRIIDPVTGGEKGTKMARFDLLPVNAMWLLAEHYGKGARKYEDRNWERGYAWSLSYAALMRHLLAFWAGEDFDQETGSLHIVAAAWHAMALTQFQAQRIGTDDRPVRVPLPGVRSPRDGDGAVSADVWNPPL